MGLNINTTKLYVCMNYCNLYEFLCASTSCKGFSVVKMYADKQIFECWVNKNVCMYDILRNKLSLTYHQPTSSFNWRIYFFLYLFFLGFLNYCRKISLCACKNMYANILHLPAENRQNALLKLSITLILSWI